MQFILETSGVLSTIEVKARLYDEIKVKQFEDWNLEELRMKISVGKEKETTLDANGILNFKCRICIPWVDGLIEKFLLEAHGLRYSIHLDVSKMYIDQKQI